MKIIKTASGNQTIKMSKSEWEKIGKMAGWSDNLDNINDEGEWDYDAEDRVPELEEDDDLLQEEVSKSGLAPDIEKMIEQLEVPVEEDPSVIDEDLKKEMEFTVKDPAELAAEQEEKERAERKEKKKREQQRYEEFLKKEVWSKPPVQ